MLSSNLFHSRIVRHDTIVVEPGEVKEITTRSNDSTVVFSNEFFNTFDIDHRLVNARLLESMEKKGLGVKSIHVKDNDIEYMYVRSTNGIVVQALKLDEGTTPLYLFCTENSTKLFTVPNYKFPEEHTVEEVFNHVIDHGIACRDSDAWDFLTSDMSHLKFKQSMTNDHDKESHSTVVYIGLPENHGQPYLPNVNQSKHFLSPLAMLVAMVTGCKLDYVKLTDHNSVRVMSELEYSETDVDTKHYNPAKLNAVPLPYDFQQPDLRSFLMRQTRPNLQHLGYFHDDDI